MRELRAGGEQRDAALANLRLLLLRVLPQGISSSLSPENPAFSLAAMETFEGLGNQDFVERCKIFLEENMI